MAERQQCMMVLFQEENYDIQLHTAADLPRSYRGIYENMPEDALQMESL
jgi:hypothetical protein